MLKHMIFRASPEALVGLPLNVRSVGYYRLPAGIEECRGPGRFTQVFWVESGQGEMHGFSQSDTVVFKDGVVGIYPPMVPHRITAGPGGLAYRWLTLDGLDTEGILAALGLSRGQQSGPCPAARFVELEACLRDVTAWGERHASLVAYGLLLEAASSDPALNATQPVSLARYRFDQDFHDARLNVNVVADQVGLHRSTLYRLFKKHYGVSPIHYLARLRLHHALRLVSETALPLAEIGERSGIPDPAYLARQIRRATGLGLRALRGAMFQSSKTHEHP
jgi:AraC-like DNA-binding protein